MTEESPQSKSSRRDLLKKGAAILVGLPVLASLASEQKDPKDELSQQLDSIHQINLQLLSQEVSPKTSELFQQRMDHLRTITKGNLTKDVVERLLKNLNNKENNNIRNLAQGSSNLQVELKIAQTGTIVLTTLGSFSFINKNLDPETYRNQPLTIVDPEFLGLKGTLPGLVSVEGFAFYADSTPDNLTGVDLALRRTRLLVEEVKLVSKNSPTSSL